jgi:hypothetical protein
LRISRLRYREQKPNEQCRDQTARYRSHGCRSWQIVALRIQDLERLDTMLNFAMLSQ